MTSEINAIQPKIQINCQKQQLEKELNKYGNRGINALKRTGLGLPKAAVGVGQTVVSAVTADLNGVGKGFCKTVEGITDVPIGIMEFTTSVIQGDATVLTGIPTIYAAGGYQELQDSHIWKELKALK